MEGVIAHRASLLCAIKPLHELLKPIVDGSGHASILVGVRRWWWVRVEGGGRSWMLVGAGWWALVPFCQWVVGDRLHSLWIAVGARGW